MAPLRNRRLRVVSELALSALLLLGVAALAVGITRARGITPGHSQPAASLTHRATRAPHVMAFPAQDLAAAGLGNVPQLITPENQPGRNGGQGITLIGAYADPARTVLIFRLGQLAGLSDVEIYDSQGFLNGSTSGGGATAGDAVFALDLGPRLSSDGVAHLTATVGLGPDFQNQPQASEAAFSIALKVQPATSLPAPALFRLGSWSTTTEHFEATPSVIHFEAVLAGATPDQIQMSTAGLFDAAGQSLRLLSENAGVTVPKQQLNSSNYANTRINYEWQRPATGGTYQLRLQGPGGSRTITFSLAPA